jgi:hypothetical protein
MNEESNKIDKEEPVKIDNEEAIKKDKEERRRRRKYSQMINYPNMNVEIQLATETDTDAELFNNMFDENQVICQNNVKRYVYCSTIFILYAAIGFMYYTYIY